MYSALRASLFQASELRARPSAGRAPQPQPRRITASIDDLAKPRSANSSNRASGERPKPTRVMLNGFDGSAEEIHFFGAVGGRERGYHVLTFDGPGQATAIHRDKLPLRPDWENVVGPVLDFLLTDPTVDPARIALLGLSLGGRQRHLRREHRHHHVPRTGPRGDHDAAAES